MVALTLVEVDGLGKRLLRFVDTAFAHTGERIPVPQSWTLTTLEGGLSQEQHFLTMVASTPGALRLVERGFDAARGGEVSPGHDRLLLIQHDACQRPAPGDC